MHGSPVTRTAAPDGRWVYTLYQQPDGYPFVHALDAAHRSAVCIGIPWKGSQNNLWATKLGLDRSGRTLTLSTRQGRPLFALDTRTFRVTRVTRHGPGFPYAVLLGSLGGATLLLLVGVALRRRVRLSALLPRPALR